MRLGNLRALVDPLGPAQEWAQSRCDTLPRKHAIVIHSGNALVNNITTLILNTLEPESAGVEAGLVSSTHNNFGSQPQDLSLSIHSPSHTRSQDGPVSWVGALGVHTDPTPQTAALLRQTLTLLHFVLAAFPDAIDIACCDGETPLTSDVRSVKPCNRFPLPRTSKENFGQQFVDKKLRCCFKRIHFSLFRAHNDGTHGSNPHPNNTQKYCL